MPKSPRPLVDNGDGTFAVPLSKGKVAIVDADDAVAVSRWCWSASEKHGKWYAFRRDHRARHTVYLHRQILDEPTASEVDHIDGDGLNNRRSNLRLASKQQNGRNRGANRNSASGRKGVHWNGCVWIAQITVDRRVMYLGRFATIDAAAMAYAEAAAELHGEFARTA